MTPRPADLLAWVEGERGLHASQKVSFLVPAARIRNRPLTRTCRTHTVRGSIIALTKLSTALTLTLQPGPLVTGADPNPNPNANPNPNPNPIPTVGASRNWCRAAARWVRKAGRCSIGSTCSRAVHSCMCMCMHACAWAANACACMHVHGQHLAS